MLGCVRLRRWMALDDLVLLRGLRTLLWELVMMLQSFATIILFCMLPTINQTV